MSTTAQILHIQPAIADKAEAHIYEALHAVKPEDRPTATAQLCYDTWLRVVSLTAAGEIPETRDPTGLRNYAARVFDRTKGAGKINQDLDPALAIITRDLYNVVDALEENC